MKQKNKDMKQLIQIQELFSVPVYKTKLQLNNDKMAKYCVELSKQDKGRVISNSGGWQSNALEGSHLILNDLFLNIEKHSNEFANFIKLNSPLHLSNLWININGYKDFNWPHLHTQCLISGVYYISTPKNCGSIFFDNPAYDTMQFDWNEKDLKEKNCYTSAKWWLPSEEGLLYIFPSWLRHSVAPNLNKKEKRISISFNVVNKG